MKLQYGSAPGDVEVNLRDNSEIEASLSSHNDLVTSYQSLERSANDSSQSRTSFESAADTSSPSAANGDNFSVSFGSNTGSSSSDSSDSYSSQEDSSHNSYSLNSTANS